MKFHKNCEEKNVTKKKLNLNIKIYLALHRVTAFLKKVLCVFKVGNNSVSYP